ncbi:MAG: DNA repair protein RadC [Candidatus Omnitrophica bacterium]|nr:DNA repair protein RadC [Candidatus Omnitrophota bacterium]MCK5493185.1 DNA repair protein RadC [Candidatus Omnitrophota bacterium]
MEKNFCKSIRSWPKEDRPREKLFKDGEHKLSNTDLLAILLSTGSKGQSAIDLARKILKKFKSFRNIGKTEIPQWKEFKGIGKAKISQIKAAIEIGRRLNEEEITKGKLKVSSAKNVVEILMPRMRDLKNEVFKVVLLNSKNVIINIVEVTEGTVNFAVPIIRKIFQLSLQNFAVSIICVHNHPSGDITPSLDDKKFTNELVCAGNALQIKVLDHIIIGDGDYVSLADKGFL